MSSGKKLAVLFGRRGGAFREEWRGFLRKDAGLFGGSAAGVVAKCRVGMAGGNVFFIFGLSFCAPYREKEREAEY